MSFLLLVHKRKNEPSFIRNCVVGIGGFQTNNSLKLNQVVGGWVHSIHALSVHVQR